MNDEGKAAAWLRLPVQGEWVATRSPAEQVPSHPDERFGMRYAFDFIRIDESGERFHSHGLLREWLGLVPAKACLAWGQPVLAPLDADVVAVGEDWPDESRVRSPLASWLRQWRPTRPRGADWRPLMGNHVLLRASVGHVLCAHLRCGSVRVRVGDSVSEGDVLGEVGQSGDCDQPHLHLQLMDAADLRVAQGLPCGFKQYERLLAGDWMPMRQGQPEWMQRVRNLRSS